jgi:hypothetical protein
VNRSCHLRLTFASLFLMATTLFFAWGRGLNAADPPASAGPRQPPSLFFVPGTLIPRVAAGVHRDFSLPGESLVLRDAPGGKELGRSANYTPYFVHGEKSSGGRSWLLLSDSYAGRDGEVRGWTLSERCEVFSARSAYAFHDTHGTVEVFKNSDDAYTIVPLAGLSDHRSPSSLAWVLSREKSKGWHPVRRTDRMPFMDLGPIDSKTSPATTPSLGTSYAGRLANVGAICGGPIDERLLGTLQEEAERHATVDMVFVVDETWSMKPFFAGVADFVGSVGKVAGGVQGRRPRIAVSYYTDGPPGSRTTISKLNRATDGTVEGIVKEVRAHRQVMPSGEYVNPPERMLEGLRDAIERAGFAEGATGVVIVIGDTGHEPQDPQKDALLDEVASLISRHSLVVFFVQVGLDLPGEKSDAQKLFEEDAKAVRARATKKYSVPEERILYQTASAVTLARELEESRRQADAIVQQANDLMARISVRNTDTRPGPALVKSMEGRGVTLAAFDRDNQQLYVPGYVWMVSPRGDGRDAANATAMTKYVFLAKQERAPVLAACESVVRDLEGGGTVDHDKAINAFAGAIDDTVLREKALAYWKDLPEGKSVGLYFSKVLGLELRSDLFYSRKAIGGTSTATRAKAALSGKVAALKRAFEVPDRFWFVASDVLP